VVWLVNRIHPPPLSHVYIMLTPLYPCNTLVRTPLSHSSGDGATSEWRKRHFTAELEERF
jgi:hypothetical protein